MAFYKKTGSIPGAIHRSGYQYDPGSGGGGADAPPPHHHHQVLYVCRGHCSGPECDFSQSLKEWHSSVWLDQDKDRPQLGHHTQQGGFQSQVVASAPKAFEKLDQKRQTLHKLKGVLAQKLEEKQNKKEKKLLKQANYSKNNHNNNNNRSASAMMMGRPDSRQSNQERCSSAMTILNNKASNYGNTNNYVFGNFFFYFCILTKKFR